LYPVSLLFEMAALGALLHVRIIQNVNMFAKIQKRKQKVKLESPVRHVAKVKW
jgi:hypothetical protein